MMEDRLNDYSDKRKMIESLDICEKKIRNYSPQKIYKKSTLPTV